MISAGAGQVRPESWLGQPMKMTDFLSPDRVIADLRVSDKRRLLDELALRSAKAAQLGSEVIAEALATRERLGSTGMGAGVAIPHARLPSLAEPIGFFARLRAPVEFDAVDGRPVDLVFLLLLPFRAGGDPLNALACVARRLRDEQAAVALRGARDARGLYALLTAENRQALNTSAS